MSSCTVAEIAKLAKLARGNFSLAFANERELRVRAFIESILFNYSQKLGFTEQEILEAMEAKRLHRADVMHYYSRSKFERITDEVGIYDTEADYREAVRGLGYRCSRCDSITTVSFVCDANSKDPTGAGCGFMAFSARQRKLTHYRYIIRETFLQDLRQRVSFMPVALEGK